MQTPQSATVDKPKESGESPVAKLKAKITARTATIGVVGIGYVGLPLALAYAEAGFRATGIDVNETYVEKLNAGTNFNKDLDDEAVRDCVKDGRLSGDTTYDQAADIDVFFICVPTPVNANKEPDTSYIQAAAEAIAETLRAGQLIILKSTTHPNTTEGLVQPILEKAAQERGLTLGEDYFLAFSPERIDPGNTTYTTANTPIVVGGVTDTCTAIATYALEQIVNEVHVVSNPRVAEMEKLLENIFRSVNIALVNELAQLCDRMGGVSIWEVVEAAATKPFGFMPFYPGPGLGGHCIPVDPHYLAWVARAYDFETSFITLSARINEQMPFYVANSVIQAIAEQPVGLKDARVLLLGVAFKKNVNDTRRSPAYTVARLLRERGVANLAFADPHVESFELKTSADGVDALPRVELSNETLQSYDVAVLLTDHDAFPYEKIAEHIPMLVDTRDGFAHVNPTGQRIRVLGAGEGRA